MRALSFLKVLNSPFKPFRLQWYCGKTQIGTPYFLPRRVDKKTNQFVTKKVGFDFVSLGWKTKWDTYRFEWAPRLSFVFFGYQIAVTVVAPDEHHYWEAWLYYERETDKTKSKKERIEQCIKESPMIYTVWKNREEGTIDYYNTILKPKYLK